LEGIKCKNGVLVSVKLLKKKYSKKYSIRKLIIHLLPKLFNNTLHNFPHLLKNPPSSGRYRVLLKYK